jgi:large subunit ribosomal protein L32e
MAEDEPEPHKPLNKAEKADAPVPEKTSEDNPEAPAATPKKSDERKKRRTEGAEPAAVEKATEKKKAHPKAPRRPTLDPELKRLLSERRQQSQRRPLFVRQQSHRYYAIGRWNTWRRPRGQQSKQRRHYGYRPTVVSIGFGSPRRTRDLTPSGFHPVLVRTARDIEAIDTAREAALVARTIGTRKRLLLEEAARRRGVHVLNPLVREREET